MVWGTASKIKTDQKPSRFCPATFFCFCFAEKIDPKKMLGFVFFANTDRKTGDREKQKRSIKKPSRFFPVKFCLFYREIDHPKKMLGFFLLRTPNKKPTGREKQKKKKKNGVRFLFLRFSTLNEYKDRGRRLTSVFRFATLK